jgi:hypothetical protein
MKKLAEYFSAWEKNPCILVEATWFFLCFFFGRRGREGWASMKKDTFIVLEDSEGHAYIATNKTETTKNHQGGHKQNDIDYGNQRMYGGVYIYTFYLSKLNPKCDRLFQHPLLNYPAEGFWYRSEPIGKNPLSQMMQTISKKAGLSKIYTCHSVRASNITILYQAGVSTQSIISITKHRNTSSLNHYISDLSSEQKRDCSRILNSALSAPFSKPVSTRNHIHGDHVVIFQFDLSFCNPFYC